METEVIQVKLVESFSLVTQIGVPFVVAFGATFLAHFLLKSHRKKETQKSTLEGLQNIYAEFRAKALFALDTTTFSLKRLESNNFKNVKIEIQKIRDNMETIILHWNEVESFYDSFDFSFAEHLRHFIDDIGNNIDYFTGSIALLLQHSLSDKTELKATEQLIRDLHDIEEKKYKFYRSIIALPHAINYFKSR